MSNWVSEELLENTVISYLVDWIDEKNIIEWFAWKQRDRVVAILKKLPLWVNSTETIGIDTNIK